MPKKSKLTTPEWILEGYDSPEAYAKAKGVKKKKAGEKTAENSQETFGSTKPKKGFVGFKVRRCPKCNSDDVGVVLSGSDEEENSKTGREWECRKCKWHGGNVKEDELTEDEFMQYLDEKGEEVM